MPETATENPMESTIRFTKRQTQAWFALALPQADADWVMQDVQAEPLDVMYGGAKGGGKAEALTAQVLTPFGFKCMGDIKVGDVVSCPDGTCTTVIVVHPQPVQQIYRLTCIDGASTRVTADHLWRSSIVGRRVKRNSVPGSSDGVYTTRELMAFIDKAKAKTSGGVRPWPLIPLCRPVEFTIASRWKKTKWPVDPYVLGVLIGDGCLLQATIHFSSNDSHIAERVREHYPVNKTAGKYDYSIPDRGKLRSSLAALGLAGFRSEAKFIPDQYKLCPLPIRWALIQGLMDTDGYADRDGGVSYTTVSEKLALDVQWIVRSLGGKATLTSDVGSYKDAERVKHVCQRAYTLAIGIEHAERLFSLPRKRDRASVPYNGGLGRRGRRVVSIEPDGVEPAQCITVRHPDGLYITDDFIVTHNSFFLCAVAYMYALEVIRYFGLQPCRDVPHIGWIGRKVAQVFTGTTLETWKTIIPPACYELVAGSEKHPRHILIDKRVAIDYGGLDNRTDLERFNSAEYGFIGVDQGEETEQDDVSTLRATRRKKLYHRELKKWLCLPYRGLWTCNPRQGWLKETFIDRRQVNKVFIPALARDNPHLPAGYIATLEDAFSHRPDLLKAYRDGDWTALSGIDQIILEEWISAAKVRAERPPYVKRWVSVDPARYGDDSCVILGGENTRIVAAKVLPMCGEPQIERESAEMSHRLGDCPIVVEVVGCCGVGDHLREQGRNVIEYCPAGKGGNAGGDLRYYNPRSRLWSTVGRWLSGGVFDDKAGGFFCLPEPREVALIAVWRKVCEQLTWPWYEFRGSRILVASKEDIKAKHNGVSPDYGDAYVNGVGHLDIIPVVAGTEPVESWRHYGDGRAAGGDDQELALSYATESVL